MTVEGPKPITIDDVQKMLGTMMLEIEMLRRENISLREQLDQKQGPVLVTNKNEPAIRP